MIGTTLDGKYRITRQIGAGAMGAVYEAEHTGTSRRVAVKVITGDVARDASLVSRFQREAKAAGAIETQYITQVFDTGIDRDTALPYMVMELLSGEDFAYLLKRLGPLNPDLALRMIGQACLGLQKAHEAGVVHRDIKPANLFLARRDAGEVIVKLLDFGIAKVKMDHAQEHEMEGAALTQAGTMLGSPLYMSPEQAKGSKTIDHRTDIWSLGVVLYQALSGRTPWQHLTALGELILSICHKSPPPLQEFAPWVPPELAAIVHNALQVDPAQRFQSAAAMFTAMRAFLPYGWAISEEMLVPLDDTIRARVQPRLEGTGRNASFASIPPGPIAGANTAGALAHSQVPPQRAPSSKLSIAVGTAVVALLGGGTVFYLLAGPAPVRAPVEPVTQAAAPVAPPAASAAPALPAAAPAPVDTAARRVDVVIVPADASIEVEGSPAKSKNGILEISGTLGSIRRVRIFKGKLETTVDVIVTESGAKPPKVELSFAPVASKSSAPATPAATTPAPTTTAPPGVMTDFQ